MTATFRLNQGGCIDRSVRMHFSFDGKHYIGYRGDTLASALIANGLRLVARSFKYHRPRGIIADGVQEPNCLVALDDGRTNLRATEIELFDGLNARGVNCWPNTRFDVGAINDLMSPLLPAGFYYKTFMWPTWSFYEWAIRRAAGLGRVKNVPDDATYDTRFATAMS